MDQIYLERGRTIRKVILKMNEELKYQIIRLLVDTNGNKKAAALRIGCSVRHINRMITGYREMGLLNTLDVSDLSFPLVFVDSAFLHS